MFLHVAGGAVLDIAEAGDEVDDADDDCDGNGEDADDDIVDSICRPAKLLDVGTEKDTA